MSVYLLMLFSWHNTVGFIFYYVRTQKALDYLRNVYVHICTTHLFVLSCMYTRLYHAAKSLQSCPTVQFHRQQLTRPRHPWDSPGKNTGVGCHFLLQCMKAKSESEVAQSCPTLSNPILYYYHSNIIIYLNGKKKKKRKKKNKLLRWTGKDSHFPYLCGNTFLATPTYILIKNTLICIMNRV